MTNPNTNHEDSEHKASVLLESIKFLKPKVDEAKVRWDEIKDNPMSEEASRAGAILEGMDELYQSQIRKYYDLMKSLGYKTFGAD